MIELIKKDWRLNRVVVVGNLVLVGLSYLMIAIAITAQVRASNGIEGRLVLAWREGLLAAGMWGIMLTILLGSVYGGIAFALERRERWGDFLNMLPVRRRTIALSKLVVAGACILTMLLMNCLLILAAEIISYRTQSWRGAIFAPDLQAVALFAGVAIMLFGVAWMLSSFLQSPAISSCIAIAATAATGFLILSLGWDQPERVQTLLRWSCAWTMMLIGTAAFVAGTAYYLRRVEP